MLNMGGGSISQQQISIQSECLDYLEKEKVVISKSKKVVEKRHAKRRSEKLLAAEPSKRNPYLKKKYADEVVLSGSAMIEE
jgi:hypothetical protein